MHWKNKFILTFLFLFYGCIPSVFISSISNQTIEKNSPIYISKFDGISMEEKIFREKLNTALKRKGYYTVNNFQKSEYYLFTNFNNRSQKNINQKKNVDMFAMELLLMDSKHVTNNSVLPIGKEDALWVCKIELDWLEFLKHQDSLVEAISKYFCNTYYGNRILF